METRETTAAVVNLYSKLAGTGARFDRSRVAAAARTELGRSRLRVAITRAARKPLQAVLPASTRRAGARPHRASRGRTVAARGPRAAVARPGRPAPLAAGGR